MAYSEIIAQSIRNAREYVTMLKGKKCSGFSIYG